MVLSSFWKGYELDVVAGHLWKSSFLPVPPCLLEPLFRARDEVPVDVALAIEGCPTEQHDSSRRFRPKDDLRVLREDQHAAALGALGTATQGSVDDVERTFLV